MINGPTWIRPGKDCGKKSTEATHIFHKEHGPPLDLWSKVAHCQVRIPSRREQDGRIVRESFRCFGQRKFLAADIKLVEVIRLSMPMPKNRRRGVPAESQILRLGLSVAGMAER